jgi:hypothetical protein
MPTSESDKMLNFITGVAGADLLKVEEDLGHGFFRLNVGEAERRQARHDIRSVEDVVVEMVRNSRDAGASRVLIAGAKDSAGIRRLTIIDDGEGVPERCRELIFEPRVTSKIDNLMEDRFGVHGRGMALYSIRSNVDQISLIKSVAGQGAVFTVKASTERLRERKDQSTFPTLKRPQGKPMVVSGPRNIPRHLAEISLDSPDLEIFFGTYAEILSTLTSPPLSSSPEEKPTLWAGLRRIDDPEALKHRAEELGLQVSARNCRRVLTGEITPAPSIGSQLGDIAKRTRLIKKKKAASLGLADEDLREFAQGVSDNFRNLAQKYFIKQSGEPQINCSRTSIRIDLPIDSDDGW